MHAQPFLAVGFVVVSLIGTPSAFANAYWIHAGGTGRQDVAPPARITPPGPFLQINPSPYLYPQVPQQKSPQYGHPPTGTGESWQERQWRERQWRESQWQDRQQQDEQARPDWRDWGQHGRSDRFSREREGRDRDWHDRRDQGSQSGHGMSVQPDADTTRNTPTWGYRENRRW